MNSVPVSSPTLMSGISEALYVTESLVATNPENTPTVQSGTPITRGQLLDTDLRPLPSSAAAQITIRSRTDQDSAPGSPRGEEVAQLQFYSRSG